MPLDAIDREITELFNRMRRADGVRRRVLVNLDAVPPSRTTRRLAQPSSGSGSRRSGRPKMRYSRRRPRRRLVPVPSTGCSALTLA